MLGRQKQLLTIDICINAVFLPNPGNILIFSIKICGESGMVEMDEEGILRQVHLSLPSLGPHS